MKTDTLIECREMFEAKANHSYSVRKQGDGHYEDRDTEAAWCGWRNAWQYFTEVKVGDAPATDDRSKTGLKQVSTRPIEQEGDVVERVAWAMALAEGRLESDHVIASARMALSRERMLKLAKAAIAAMQASEIPVTKSWPELARAMLPVLRDYMRGLDGKAEVTAKSALHDLRPIIEPYLRTQPPATTATSKDKP